MSGSFTVLLRDVIKSVKALEIRRVAGAKCHYKYIDLLLHHEDDLDITKSKGQFQSGTKSIVKVHQAMTFMLAFLHELHGALVQDRSFRHVDRSRIYQVCILLYQKELKHVKRNQY